MSVRTSSVDSDELTCFLDIGRGRRQNGISTHVKGYFCKHEIQPRGSFKISSPSTFVGCVWGAQVAGRGHTAGVVGTLRSPYGFQELKSHDQGWQKVSLPAGPSCWPTRDGFKMHKDDKNDRT